MKRIPGILFEIHAGRIIYNTAPLPGDDFPGRSYRTSTSTDAVLPPISPNLAACS